MKLISLLVLLSIAVATVFGADPAYQDQLRSAHDRFAQLEMLRSDYRKAEPRLSPAQEQERLQLHGQLLRDDPVWVLTEQISADIEALKAMPAKTDSDTALIDSLKNFLAIVSGHNGATTRAQAEEHAMVLRQFVARRDYEGALAWSKLH